MSDLQTGGYISRGILHNSSDLRQEDSTVATTEGTSKCSDKLFVVQWNLSWESRTTGPEGPHSPNRRSHISMQLNLLLKTTYLERPYFYSQWGWGWGIFQDRFYCIRGSFHKQNVSSWYEVRTIYRKFSPDYRSHFSSPQGKIKAFGKGFPLLFRTQTQTATG